jgi:hypothetical protein|nr:MAG TPA: hypothetical protein [Caudoviricetes sp.]
MSKYNKLKKQIFEHDWFISNDIDYCKEIIYNITKLEIENNKFTNIKVIENVFVEKGFNNNWIVGLVTENTNKIGRHIGTTRYLEIIELSYFAGSLFTTYITMMNNYNIDKIKSIM